MRRLKVLALVDLVDKILEDTVPALELRDLKSTGELLGMSKVPSSFVRRYGQPATGVPRTGLNLALKDTLQNKGITLHEGWKLQKIEETETGVIAFAADGRQVEGSFLVGCDGLKSVSRGLFLQRKGASEKTPTFTGLIQVDHSLS